MNKQTRRFTFYGLLTLILGITADLNLNALLTKTFSWITLVYLICGVISTGYFYFLVMETLNEDDETSVSINLKDDDK
jgi:hypothetical protein